MNGSMVMYTFKQDYLIVIHKEELTYVLEFSVFFIIIIYLDHRVHKCDKITQFRASIFRLRKYYEVLYK